MSFIIPKDYESALSLLAEVESTSSCASQATSLTNKIRSQIRSDQQAELRREERAAEREANLEKYRINAARDVAKAYYNRTQPRITYNTLINNTLIVR